MQQNETRDNNNADSPRRNGEERSRDIRGMQGRCRLHGKQMIGAQLYSGILDVIFPSNT